ncbi:MAG: 30S ribosomal protein S8 [Candidatus Pacebacteria bacterium]|nr:30S ribosomal protein S8 [Candidatus Paceibacterota bacterium]
MDKIADMLVAIKNAGNAGKESLTVPYSNYRADIARALFQEGYVKSYSQKKMKKGDRLEIDVLYKKDKSPRISYVKRISKPSRRLYTGTKGIYTVRQGFGTLFLSTPKGILTGDEAKTEMVGGEMLFEIA